MQNINKNQTNYQFTLTDHQYIVDIPNGKFPNCTNCLDDAYDIDQTNFIYKNKYGQFPQWIKCLNNAYVKKQKMVDIKSRQYRFKIVKCRLGNYHVLSAKGKPFPMIKQLYNLLQKAHSSNHYPIQIMASIIDKQQRYEKFGINKYYYNFVKNCKKCTQYGWNSTITKSIYNRNIINQKHRDINQKLKQISISKKILSTKPKIKNIQWNFQTCPYNCEDDVYQSKYIGYVPFFMYGNKPPQIKNKVLQKYSKKKLLTSKSQSHCIGVIRCQKGTFHLWKLPHRQRQLIDKSQKQLAQEGCKRIAMKRQKIQVMKKIHDSFGHISGAGMKIELRKSPYLSPPFYEQLNNIQFCSQCKKQRQVNPKKNIIKDQNYTKNQLQKSCNQYLQFKMQQDQNKQSLHTKLTQQNFKSFQNYGIKYKKNINSNGYLTSVFSTNQMINKYYQLGDCLFLSQIIGLSCMQKLYFITGIDKNGFPTLFSIIIVEDYIFNSYYYLFSMFFQLMEFKFPKTIYIPVDGQICSALSTYTNYFKRQGNNIQILFLKNNILDKLWVNVRKQCKQKLIMLNFDNAIQANFDKQYKQQIVKLNHNLIDRSILTFFINLSTKCCKSQIKNKFCSISFLQNYIHHLKNKIKKLYKYSYSLYIYHFIKDLKTIDHIIGTFQKPLFIQTIQIQQQLSLKYTSQIVKKLKSQIIKSYQLKSQKIDILNEIIYDKKDKINLIYSLSKSCWICQCKRIYKDGFPCIHLIYIIRKYYGKFQYYISSRWIT